MAITNPDRVGKALDSLSAGLGPYVERELKAVFDTKWIDALKDGAPKPPAGKKAHALNLADTQVLLGAKWNHWNEQRSVRRQ